MSAWGMTQDQRRRAALAPGHAQLDGRTPAQLLAMATPFARLLNYINPQDQKQGDWQPFFDSDPCFLLAEIACLASGPTTLEQGHDAQLGVVARRFYRWYRRAMDYENTNLRAQVNGLLLTLRTVILDDLLPCLKQLDGGRDELILLGSLFSIAPTETRPAMPPPLAGSAAMSLGLAARLFDSAQQRLSQVCARYLDEALVRNDRPPQTSLYLAFVQLFRHIQRDSNQFTDRHLNYYYQDILGLAPAPSQPDRVPLVLRLADNCDEFVLPAGSRFDAGKNLAGQPVIFANDVSAALNRASIAALCTLRQVAAARGPSVPATPTWIQAIHAAPIAASADGLGATLPAGAAWPPFSPPQPDTAAQRSALQATLGAVLASPALLLTEGERSITLELDFNAELAAKLLETYREQMALCYEEGYAPALETALAEALTVELSGSAGWFDAGVPLLTHTLDELVWRCRLHWTLASNAPPVCANPALLPAPGSPWPLLRLRLNPDARVYAYSLFAPLTLQAARFAVSASGLRQLQIETGLGKVAPGKAFAPFGMQAPAGASFRVSHPELGAKRLRAATLRLEWQSLPDPADFADYYSGYQDGTHSYAFNTQGFHVGLAIFSDGDWRDQLVPKLPPQRGQFALFRVASGQRPAGDVSFTLDYAALPWSYDSYEKALPLKTAAPGSIEVVLSAPAYGFGAGLYPRLFALNALRNAKILQGGTTRTASQSQISITTEPQMAPSTSQTHTAITTVATVTPLLPGQRLDDASQSASLTLLNPPFVPMVKAATLSYQAEDSLTLPDQASPARPCQLYHLWPFGAAPATTSALLPTLAARAQLLLGIVHARPGQTLQLYAALREADASQVSLSANAAVTPLVWHYLQQGQWQPFPHGAIGGDTNQLRQSGMLSLRLPDRLDPAGTLMPALSAEGALWLRASTDADPDSYAPLLALLPQAIYATRLDSDTLDGPPLAAGSISGMLSKPGQVAAISQPFAASGGRMAEDENSFRIRLSERLRHKQRPSLPPEFEAMALALAPTIWQAKCIGANTRDARGRRAPLAPGQIVLALAPPIDASTRLPALLPSSLLSGVAAALQAVASPQINRITVRNIACESVTVHVSLRLRADSPGDAQKRLNAALNAALSPWQQQGHLDIGCGAVQAAALASMLQALPYVDEVGPLALSQLCLDQGQYRLRWADDQGGQAAIWPSTPWSMLVPVAQHQLNLNLAPLGQLEGIGVLAVARDFVVSAADTREPS